MTSNSKLKQLLGFQKRPTYLISIASFSGQLPHYVPVVLFTLKSTKINKHYAICMAVKE